MNRNRWIRFATVALAALLLLQLLTMVGCGDDDPAAPPVPPVDPYLYVDAVHGSVDGSGSASDPLADLPAAIARAAVAGKDVRVAEGEFEVDSSAGDPIVMDAGVSLLGGYLNDGGTWTRDPGNHPTVIRDLATAGGTFDAPRCAVYCQWDSLPGATPVLDGFVIEAGNGDWTCAVAIGDSTAVTISDCRIRLGVGLHAHGIKNASNDSHNTALITISDCVVSGGGGSGSATGIYVSRSDVTIVRTTVTGPAVTGAAFGVDVGYGDVIIADCEIRAGAGSSTYGLYLNEAYECTVSGCTIYGGDATLLSTGVSAMDSEASGSYHDNDIDGGTGQASAALHLGWVEANPAIDDNVLRCSGGVDRYGIWETCHEADPISLRRNAFDASLLAGTGTSALYHDVTVASIWDYTAIADVNALDENGRNPADSVEDNTLTGGATR